MRTAVSLAAALILAATAQAGQLETFVSKFGENGLGALAERGALVVQGRIPERRLAAVHWKALEAFTAAVRSCRRLPVLAADGPASLPDQGLAPCRALAEGVMTSRLQALASAVVAEGDVRWALVTSSASLAEPPGVPNFFDTSWGKQFASRHRAERRDDLAPFAKPFFDEILAGLRPIDGAAEHFIAVSATRGAAELESRLSADAARGSASEDLRAVIRRYLEDEGRRHGLFLARERRKALLNDKATRADLDALALLADKFSTPGLLSSLESAESSKTASGVPRLRSAGLHLREPVRLDQYELGDDAVVSGAYWVDGLPENGFVEIEETTWIETPYGFTGVETRSVKRRNGGPYPFERALNLSDPDSFTLVARVSASSGTIVTERAEVAIAPDFELALKRESNILQSLQTCDPKSAQASAAALEELVTGAAKVKPQYKSLLGRVKRERETAASDREKLTKLEELVNASKADAAPEQCRYDLKQTDAAIKLARSLPPGCDRFLPGLFGQRALISRRAADQAWFLKTSAEARSLRRSCDFNGAARRWTEALSVLEVDPSARCGAVDGEAKAAEAELPLAVRSQIWTDTLTKSMEKSEIDIFPAQRLAKSAPLIARLQAVGDGACRSALLKRAVAFSEKAGADEAGPQYSDAQKLLPPDTNLDKMIDDTRRARAKALEKSDAANAPDDSDDEPNSAPAAAAAPAKAAAKRGSR